MGCGHVRNPAGYEPGSAAEEANYAKWLDQTEARELARQDRIHGAAGIMPVPLWIVLFFIAAIIFVFLLGMADRGERTWVPPLFMGSVVAVITAMLLLLNFLDDPVHSRCRWTAAGRHGANVAHHRSATRGHRW